MTAWIVVGRTNASSTTVACRCRDHAHAVVEGRRLGRLLLRALVTLLASGLNPAGSPRAQTVRGRFALEVPESGEYSSRWSGSAIKR